jgi:hypothetical protein
MSVKINTVTKQLPKYSRTTADYPFLDAWPYDKTRAIYRKSKKIFEGAAER